MKKSIIIILLLLISNIFVLNANDINKKQLDNTSDLFAMAPPPLLILLVQDATVHLDNNGNYSLSDSDVYLGNQNGIDIVSVSLSPNLFNCSNIGDNDVTITVEDINGQVKTADVTVTVEDNIMPLAKAKSINIELDANGNASLSPSQVDDGSSDNCTINLSIDKTSFTSADLGENTITLTVTDGAGNSNSVNTTVNVLDNLPPSITCSDNAEINTDSDKCCGSTTLALPTVSDNCTVVGDLTIINSITGNSNRNVCLEKGINTITWTVTDGSGNSSQCSQTIKVFDRTSPIAKTKNVTIGLDVNGKANLSPSQIDNGSIDNCTIDTYTINKSLFTCSDLGSNTVTLKVIDENGNFAEANARVTVEDNIAPRILTKNIDLNLDVEGRAEIKVSDINNGSNDNCTLSSLSLDITKFTCDNLGENTVILTGTDQSGNSSSMTATVTVHDVLPPTMSKNNIEIYLDKFGSVTIETEDINDGTADACGISEMYLSKYEFDCEDLGINIVKLTAIDNQGNVGTVNARVTVKDNIKPKLTKNSFELYLDENGEVEFDESMLEPYITDNCEIDGFEVSETEFTCDDMGDLDVDLIITEKSGRETEYSITLEILDERGPEIYTNDIDVYLDENGEVEITADDLDNGTYDNCELDEYEIDTDYFSCDDLGENTVEFIAYDEEGNESEAEVTVTVYDNISPIAITQDLTIELDENGIATIIPSQIDFGSFDNCEIANLQLNRDTFTCDDLGQRKTNLKVTDNSGNHAISSAWVTVLDKIKPTISQTNFDVFLDNNGNATFDKNILAPYISDNCSVKSFTLDRNTFVCSEVGIQNVTLTITDNSDNVNIVTIQIEVKDNVKPIVITQNIDLYLDIFGDNSIVPNQIDNGSSDNCDINSFSLSKSSFDSEDVGENTVILTAIDVNGNTSSATAIVNVIDNIPPTVITNDITVELNSNGEISITPDQIDNGSNDASGIDFYSLDISDFNCMNLGTNTVTLTVTDLNGNSASNTAIVTVIDVLSPNVMTNDITVQLDENGNVEVNIDDINNGSTDNCSIKVLSLMPNNFDCNDIGVNSVTLTATDDSGNFSSQTAIVTVEDNVLPTIITKTITVELDENGTATIEATDIDNGTTDACGIASISIDNDTFDCESLGLNVINFTATDNNGNIASASTSVTVLDNTLPSISETNFDVQLGENGATIFDTSVLEQYLTDNCGVANFGLENNHFMCSDLGETQVNLTINDNSSNTTTIPLTFNVTDIISPTIVAVDEYELELDQNLEGDIDINNIDLGTYDNCEVSSLTLSNTQYDCNSIGQNGTVTLTATDNSGNQSTKEIALIIKENVPPVAKARDYVFVYLDETGQHTLTAADVDEGSTDNCGIVRTEFSKEVFNCDDVGNHCQLVTYTVYDASGNSDSETFYIVVKDKVKPVVKTKDVTVALGNNGWAEINWEMIDDGSTDNCGIKCRTIFWRFFNGCDLGENNVSYYVWDNNWNFTREKVKVTVIDTIFPVIKVKDNIVVNMSGDQCKCHGHHHHHGHGKGHQHHHGKGHGHHDKCDNSGLSISDINNGSYDNDLIVKMWLSQTEFDCDNLGNTTVTIYAQDRAGNISSKDVQVTIIDNEKPTVKTKCITLNLDENGNGNLTPEMIDNGSYDNCGIKTLSVSESSFDCNTLGYNRVKLTAEDNAGNTAYEFTWVYVKDNTAPNMIGNDITISLDNDSDAYISVNDIDNGSSDNCNLKKKWLSKTHFDCDDVGVNYIYLYGEDNACNRGSVKVKVTITDEVAPVVYARNKTIYLNKYGRADLEPWQVDDCSHDNCGIKSRTLSQTEFDIDDVGVNNVIFTVTDKAGNSSSKTVQITIKDNRKPEIICMPDNIEVKTKNNDTSPYTSVSWKKPKVKDNSIVKSFTSNYEPGDDFPIGSTKVTYTAEDYSGNKVKEHFYVKVKDKTKPTLTLSANHTILSNPNHKMRNIKITATMSDNSGEDVSLKLKSIKSNEKDKTKDKKDKKNDIQNAKKNKDDREFDLRAEVMHNSKDRIYTIKYQAKDKSGNKTNKNIKIRVPNQNCKATFYTSDNLTHEIQSIYPNPMQNNATIKYNLGEETDMKLYIIDQAGRHIVTIEDTHKEAGLYELTWNGKDQSGQEIGSGTFMVMLQTNKGTIMQILTIVR